MNRRAILTLPLLGPALAVPATAVAATTGTAWHDAVGALAGSPDERTAAAYQSAAAATLAGVTDPAAQALVTAVARNARESYAGDGGRFGSAAAGVRTFDANGDLLAWLLDEPAAPVDAVTGLLRAGRVAANVAVGDLAAAAGERGADPDLAANAGRREALLHARTTVRTGSELTRAGTASLRNADPSAAFAQWTAAWALASDALARITTGAGPADGATQCRHPSHRRWPRNRAPRG